MSSPQAVTRRKSVKVPRIVHADEHGLFFGLLKREKIALPECEARFHPVREWRFDFLWREQRVFLEVDGGIWLKGGGRHTRGSGWLKDTDKLNAAAAMGYRHLRCTPQQLHDLAMIATIRETLNWKSA